MGQDQTETGSRAATIAFTINGMRCSDAVKRLVEKRIAVRNGRFYALRCLEALGIEDPDVRGVPGNRYSYRESRVNSIY